MLEVKPIMDYLNQFQNFLVIQEEIAPGNGEISFLVEGELMKILFLDMKDAKWWSIYRYHLDGIKYEQIDVMLYDEIKENNYNHIIKYSYHIEEGAYSFITCSCFSYLYDKMIRSWKHSRVVPMEDLKEIQYCEGMNLTELILMTDEKSHHILKKEDCVNVPLSLKLEKEKF